MAHPFLLFMCRGGLDGSHASRRGDCSCVATGGRGGGAEGHGGGMTTQCLGMRLEAVILVCLGLRSMRQPFNGRPSRLSSASLLLAVLAGVAARVVLDLLA
jgi:hypothetical protein